MATSGPFIRVKEILKGTAIDTLPVPAAVNGEAVDWRQKVRGAVHATLEEQLGKSINAANLPRLTRVLRGVKAQVPDIDADTMESLMFMVQRQVKEALGMVNGAAAVEVKKPVEPKKPAAPKGRKPKPKPTAPREDTGRKYDPFNVYLKQMGEIPLLSREDEVELGKRKDEGGVDAELAKNELIRANLRLVVSIARGYVYRGIPVADVVQEGNIGLMKAAEKFDYSRGFRFSTYASWWIRQAIVRFIEENVRTIRIPIYKLEIFNKIKQLQKEAIQNTGRELSMGELAEALEIDEVRLQELMEMNKEPVSLQAPIKEDSSTTMGDMLADPKAVDPTAHLDADEDRDLVLRFLDKSDLDRREIRVIKLRYGLEGPGDLSLEDIGAMFGVTRERIRQIEIKALRKMRTRKNRLASQESV